MTQKDYQQLAKEMLDMWQKQLSNVMSDKQFIQSMLQMFQSFNHNTPHDSSTTSPFTATAQSGHDPDLLAELSYRVGMCEQRLAALEKHPKKPASGPAKRAKPRGKRTSA